jgi:hypothetical protein
MSITSSIKYPHKSVEKGIDELTIFTSDTHFFFKEGKWWRNKRVDRKTVKVLASVYCVRELNKWRAEVEKGALEAVYDPLGNGGRGQYITYAKAFELCSAVAPKI